jgi:hypothetical protein
LVLNLSGDQEPPLNTGRNRVGIPKQDGMGSAVAVTGIAGEV